MRITDNRDLREMERAYIAQIERLKAQVRELREELLWKDDVIRGLHEGIRDTRDQRNEPQ